jgi:DNA-binding PucR family transcriptional regulator
MREGPVPIGTGPDLRHDAVPMHTWASDRSVSPEVAERIREIAQRQLDRLDELTAAVQAAVVRVAPLLAEDPALYAESLASTRANNLRFLMLTVSHPGEPAASDPPPEAVDIARSVMRRGADTEMVVLTYRAGQNAFWESWLDAAAELVADRDELVEVLRLSSVLVFDYIDGVLTRVLTRAEEEREELLRGGLARRAETVRMILDDVPIAEQRASERLGYELSRTHTCVVLWSEDAVEQGTLDRAAHALAHAVGARHPLLLPATVAAVWAWIGTAGEPDLAPLRAAMEDVDPAIRAAVGPSCPGLAGFRRSHDGAVATHGLVAGARGGERLTTYRDVEVTALVAQDPRRMTDFVRTTLGPLAGRDAAAARLRETLRIYLSEGESAPRAARRLYAHRNTVLQRVARAEELLGHPIADRRLELALALELTHRLGGRMLA